MHRRVHVRPRAAAALAALSRLAGCHVIGRSACQEEDADAVDVRPRR